MYTTDKFQTIKDLLSGLSPEQVGAITCPEKQTLVLGGAGSGKTRVLTTRVAWLLLTGKASPSSILVITFTNNAARELKTRLAGLVPANVTTAMRIGTFHHLSYSLLHTHHRDTGLPKTFQVLDSQAQLAAIKRLLISLELSQKEFKPRTVQSFINSRKEAGLRSDGLPKTLNPYEEKLAELYTAYDAQCNREGVVDFAELLLRSYELLSTNQGLHQHYCSRFRHILLDEFQDTSRLQYDWIKLFSSTIGSLFAIGDENQSIYAFRGADVGNMRALLNYYSISEAIHLGQNHRSTGNIVKAANALIQHNDDRLSRGLWTAAGDGEKIRLFNASSDKEEAEFIIDEVCNLKRSGIKLSDIAILYRSNAQSSVLEQVLCRINIPYFISGSLNACNHHETQSAQADRHIFRNPEDDNARQDVINAAANNTDALRLMTVHAAKGLEFRIVFISGLEEGLFPHLDSIKDGKKGLEEERRLMYVAITRAQQRLYLSHAQQRLLGRSRSYLIRSRFIDEIPEQLTHDLSATAETEMNTNVSTNSS